MMKESEPPPLPPFAGFHVETETKADGRLVRYYSWNPEAAIATPAIRTEGTGGTSGGDEAEGVGVQSTASDDGAPGSREATAGAVPSDDEGRAGV